MFYYWRKIATSIVTQRFRPPVDFGGELVVGYRVRALDCDGLRVMSAMHYPKYMDLARWEVIARSGLLRLVLREGIAPVLGAQRIVYRKPIKRGERFRVRVCVEGWDERWIYILHRFEARGECVAFGLTKALFWKRGDVVPATDLLRRLGIEETNRTPPAWVADTFASDADDLQITRPPEPEMSPAA